MAGRQQASERDEAPSSWQSGQLIAGKFRLRRELGRGGMGEVWEAEHLALGAAVAIKLIAPDSSESTLGVVRFVREAKAAAALRSPHVVQMLDHGIDGAVPYIVMELLEGETLAARLERLGKLGDAETLQVVTHIARALARAQERGIVHRDLKPANVMVVRAGDEELTKVLDFGVAKDLVTGAEDTYETKTGTVVGTPKYMSPEQARGRRVDWRSDLWSLAVIAYECHLGEVPFRGAALGELLLQICGEPLPVPSEHGEVAPGFDDWWRRATHREPAERFQSALELAGALRTVLAPEDTASARASSTEQQPHSWARGLASTRLRWFGLAALLGSVTALAVSGRDGTNAAEGLAPQALGALAARATDAAREPSSGAGVRPSDDWAGISAARDSNAAERTEPQRAAVAPASAERGPSRVRAPGQAVAPVAASNASASPPAATQQAAVSASAARATMKPDFE